MSPIIAQEFEKLTDKQKAKFRELESWQNQSKVGMLPIQDSVYEQILKWVKTEE